MITRISAYLSYRRFGKNNSCGQVAERLATQQRVLFLKGINYQGFLPVFQFQKADAQIFFISSFAFVSMSRSSCS